MKPIVVASIAIVFCCEACETDGVRPLQVGASLPRAAADALESVSGIRAAHVVWVFRPEDCLSCQAATRYLRTLQPVAEALDVGLVAVSVGDREEYVEEFMRRDRLDAVTVVRGQPAIPFGTLRPIPSLLIVIDGEVAELLPVKPSPAADTIRVREVVVRLLSERNIEGRRGEATLPGR